MNSKNNILTYLPPPSTAEACNSNGPKPRLIFELWGFQPTGIHLGSSTNTRSTGGVRLAMVDIDLPNPTGFEVVAGALAQGWLQNTTIIFLSGDPSDGRVAMARQFPGSIFVPKPFEMQKLLGLIRKLFPNEPSCEC
ncbi:MAG: Response regulator receiver domain [Verrucomicrobiota bacterium]|jgi:DNA-binding response OmpR family regulator